MKRIATRALALGTSAAALTTAGRADGLLNDWNVVVTGDAYVGVHTEGPVRVGGNLYVHGGQYGISPRAGTLSGTGGVGLMVGGNVVGADVGGVKLNQESGSSATTQALIGGSSTQANVFANGTATVGDTSVPGTVAGDAALLRGYSQAFAGMTAPSANTFSGGTFHVTTVDANGNAVFDVNATDVFTANTSLSIGLNGHSFGTGQSIVINVKGDVNVPSSFNFSGNFAENSSLIPYVIWNFTNAASINLNGKGFNGTILAPDAILTNTQGNLNGGVFVKQIGTSLNPFDGQGGEIHPPLYNGYVPNAVPEPTGLAMAGIAALAGAAFGMRRRVAG